MLHTDKDATFICPSTPTGSLLFRSEITSEHNPDKNPISLHSNRK